MIKKVITGNQAVESDTFQLVVTVTGTAGEKYKVTLDNAEQNPLTSGEKAIRGFCSQRRKESTKCSIYRTKTL